MKTQPTILIDTREQTPWSFSMPTQRATLTTGDYSIGGLESLVTIERKSLHDFVVCCGSDRKRFTRELDRLRGYPFRAVFIESDLTTIERGDWRSKLQPPHILGAIASWSSKHARPIFLAGNAEMASRLAERCLVRAARHIIERNKNAAAFLSYARHRT